MKCVAYTEDTMAELYLFLILLFSEIGLCFYLGVIQTVTNGSD
jgi:hypothetical protein